MAIYACPVLTAGYRDGPSRATRCGTGVARPPGGQRAEPAVHGSPNAAAEAGSRILSDRCGHLLETGRYSVRHSVRVPSRCWQCASAVVIDGERQGALATVWRARPGSTP